MAKDYILTIKAREDLGEIIHYIAESSPSSARRIKEKFIAAFSLLGERPNIGHLRQDLTERPLRFWSLYHYAIVYRADTSPITVTHIVSAYRDLNKLL